MAAGKRQATKKRANPDLLRQLDRAEKDGSSVQAVLFLRNPVDEESFPSPDETTDTVKRLVRRVERQVGESVRDYNVFRNIGSFVVEASPRVVRALVDQNEIRSATPNRPGKAAKSALKAR